MIKKVSLISSISLILLIMTNISCTKVNLDTDPGINLKFGLEMAMKGLWKEAVIRWEYGLKLNPNDARLHNNLAVAYENLREWDKAKIHYEQALKLDPENRDILFNYRDFERYIKMPPDTTNEEPRGIEDEEER